MDTDECVLGEPALLPNPPPGRVQGWGNKLFLWFGNSCRAWKGRKGAPRPREPDFLGRSPLATRRGSEPAPPSLRDPGVGRFGCASGPSLAANLTTPDSLRTTSEGGRGRGTWGAPPSSSPVQAATERPPRTAPGTGADGAQPGLGIQTSGVGEAVLCLLIHLPSIFIYSLLQAQRQTGGTGE